MSNGVRLGRWQISATALVVTFVFVVTALTAGSGALRFGLVSPIDETSHFDYAYKVYEGDLIPTDPYMSNVSLTAAACRGSLYAPPDPVACKSGVHNPDETNPSDVNYVLMYFPMYYAVVAAGMHVLHPFGVTLFTAARLTNSLLFAIAACLLALALIRLRVSRRMAAGMVLALAAVPNVQFWGSTIAPDSCALLFGALGLLLLTQRVNPKTRVRRGVILGVLAGLTTANLAPIGVFIIASACLLPEGLCAGEAGNPIRLPRQWDLARAIALCAVPMVVALAWSEFRYLELPVVNAVHQQIDVGILHTTKSLPSLLAEAAATFAQPLGSSFLIPPRNIGVLIWTVLNLTLFGGSVILALDRSHRVSGSIRLISIGYLCTFVLNVFYLVVPFYVAAHDDDDSARYAIQLLPLALAAVALAVDRKALRWLVFLAGLVITLYFVVRVAPATAPV